MNSNVSRSSTTKKRESSTFQSRSPEFDILAPFTAKQVRTLSLSNPAPNAPPNSRVFVVDIKIAPSNSDQNLINYCSGSDSACECVYIVGDSSVNGSSYIRAPVLHVESELIRCDGSIIAQAPSAISVMLHFNNEGFTTNSVSFVPSTQTVRLDNPNAFNPIVRHQCYRETFIPHFANTDLIDPIQSNDPKNIIYYNYYTDNLGRTTASFAERSRDYGVDNHQRTQSFPSQNVIASEIYHCPDLMGYANSHQNPNLTTTWQWLNRVFFKQHNEGMINGNPNASTFGSYGIFPFHDPRPLKIDGGILRRDNSAEFRNWADNRMTNFYLARVPASAYTEPVFAVQYPQPVSDLNTNQNNSNNPIQQIGFAIAPKEVGNDSVCPNDSRWPASEPVQKPAGFNWKKLWQATTSKDPFKRKRIRSQPADLGSIREIFCNPGNYTGDARAPSGVGRAVIPACAEKTYNTVNGLLPADFYKGTKNAINASESNASRFFYGINRCYQTKSSNEFTYFSLFNEYSGGQLGGGNLNDSQRALVEAFSISNFSEITLKATTDTIDQSPAHDWIFFVTEPSVQKRDIEIQYESRYQPIRLGSIEGCVKALGGAPTLSDILADFDLARYGSNSKCHWVFYELAHSSVEQNPVVPVSPENPGGNRRVPATYPLCVLQPDDEGLRI